MVSLGPVSQDFRSQQVLFIQDLLRQQSRFQLRLQVWESWTGAGGLQSEVTHSDDCLPHISYSNILFSEACPGPHSKILNQSLPILHFPSHFYSSFLAFGTTHTHIYLVYCLSPIKNISFMWVEIFHIFLNLVSPAPRMMPSI